jgi:hypothetical protein
LPLPSFSWCSTRRRARSAEHCPSSFHCRVEEVTEHGRFDLSFRDQESGWHVVIEIKIHAGFHGNQLERYLLALPSTDRAALAAITRDVPKYGDPNRADPRWRGSVQWGRVLPALRALAPADAALAVQWPLFLDVLESEGAMGFTHADPQLFHA